MKNHFTKFKNNLRKLMFKIELSINDAYSLSKVYHKYLGVEFGKGVVITGKVNFGSEPYLVKIGNGVRITNNVTFHTHDGGVGILRDEYPDINVFGRIEVKDNVFIGSDTTILPNVTIHQNVVVGASSIVTKDLEANFIYAGVPAKKIKSLEEYKTHTLKNAVYIHSHDPLERKNEILRKISELKNK